MVFFRSKRKVLGRKEPSDSFSSRQNLVSPVKHSSSGADPRNLTLGSSQRSSSRNENFMALLQKKGSKSSSGGARVSAMELLKSTNPLARRITEFSTTTPSNSEGEDPPLVSDKPFDQWMEVYRTPIKCTACNLPLGWDPVTVLQPLTASLHSPTRWSKFGQRCSSQSCGSTLFLQRLFLLTAIKRFGEKKRGGVLRNMAGGVVNGLWHLECKNFLDEVSGS